MLSGFAEITPEDVAILEKLPSLRTVCTLPGDVVILPPGLLTIEKILNSHFMVIRAPTHLVHVNRQDAYDKLTYKANATLVLFGHC